MAYRKVAVWGAFLLLDLALMLRTAPVNASQDSAPPPAGALAGKIVDAAGQPAAGATVWLFSGSSGDLKDLEKTTTDTRGRFMFLDAQAKYSHLPYGSLPRIFVQSAQGQIGWDQNLWGYPQNKPLQVVRIQLIKTGVYRGRLVDAAGKPIAKASIRPLSFECMMPGQRNSNSTAVCPALIEKCRGETDADGSFTLNSMPLEGKVSADIAAPGLAAFRARWSLEKRLTLQLPRPGKIQGSLAAPAGADTLAGVKIHLSPRSNRESQKDLGYQFFPLNWETSTNKDGSFQFTDIPRGKYGLYPELIESDLAFTAKTVADFEVKADETAIVSVALSPAIEVRGQVVDEQSGKGIQGVRVLSYLKMEDAGYSTPGRFATTDSDGNYRLFTEAGKIGISVNKSPAEYLEEPVENQTGWQDAKQPIVFPTIKLAKAMQLEGIAVDESGKPVSKAEIQMLLMRNHCELFIENADENGCFTVKRLAPKKHFSLRARTANAVSNTMDVLPAEVSEPLRLVLSSQQVFKMKGVCLDEAGQPVREAIVSANSVWMLGATGLGMTDGSAQTDADGRFEIGSLWPGSTYTLRVNAANCGKYEAPRVEATRDQMHDFGKIVLRDESGFVEGIVVDAAGEPLADVCVFHHRDAAKPLSGVTDASGKFRLTGLRSGSDYVFAEKKGYRLKSAYLPTKSEGVKIVLSRRDEPVPPWKPARSPASFAEEQTAARKLLDKLYQVPHKGPGSWSYRFIARFDQSRALELSKKFNGYYKSKILRMVVEQIADADLEETIALLNPYNDYHTFQTFCILSERCASIDAEKASRLMEEAILIARRFDQPNRSQALAEAGSLAVRLGKAEAGRKIIEEAAEAAAKMGTGDGNASIRSHIAAALAPHDLSRALSLIEPLADKNSRDDGMAAIAVATASNDLDKALDILSKVDKRSTLPDNTRLRIAYQLAPTRPEDALRAVDSMDTHGAKKIRAEAYGCVAELIAPRDQKLAWSLIDKSIAIYEENAQEMRSWRSYGDRGTFAAHLVVKAAKCDYPELGELVDRVLAMRPTDDEGYRIRETQKNTVLMARVLALIDPELAKHLLATVAKDCESLQEFGDPGVELRDWCQAWALADLPQVTGMLERRLERAAADPTINLDRCGLDETLELLTTPADKRIPVMDRTTRSFWSPQED